MENKEQGVELTSEPKFETRFGFSDERKILSSRAVKVCTIATTTALAVIFLMKSPEKISKEGPGINAPENIQAQSGRFTADSYSAVQENDRLKEKNKKQVSKTAVRLPGLQKIDRRHAGQIPPGSMIKAVLVTGASNGPVRVETKEALRIQGETLIPEGAVLLGAGQSTEERLIVRFNQVVFKDGSFENISAQAADAEDRTVGLRGSRVGRVALKYAAAIGLNFVSGMAEVLQDRDVVGQQAVAKPTAKNALLNGTSKATVEMANETMTDLRNNAPIIQIDAGKEIIVIFDGG